MLQTIQAFEVRLANFLPGLKTKILLAVGFGAQFLADVKPELLTPIVPPSWQPFMPLAFYAAAFYAAHRLPKLRLGA